MNKTKTLKKFLKCIGDRDILEWDTRLDISRVESKSRFHKENYRYRS